MSCQENYPLGLCLAPSQDKSLLKAKKSPRPFGRHVPPGLAGPSSASLSEEQLEHR